MRIDRLDTAGQTLAAQSPAPSPTMRHRRTWRVRQVSGLLAVCLLAGLTLLPSTATATVSQSTQSPAAYLSSALTWLQAYDVYAGGVDWTTLRQQAQHLARHARTPADTYPAIMYVIAQMGDRLADLSAPNQPNLDSGYNALYPDGLVIYLEPGGPAARAGLRMGDRIQSLNGKGLQQEALNGWINQGTAGHQRLVVRRNGRLVMLTVAVSTTWAPARGVDGRRIGDLGYVLIPATNGVSGYATLAQRVLQRLDQPAACGWIIDLRQTEGGDIWSYLAAVGPVLGEGSSDGFLYRDGHKEPWTYQFNKVYWNGAERFEDQISGQAYTLSKQMPPVALLVDQTTSAAGELAAVAFAGRPGVRTFGQPTWGAPTFVAGTTLSDGANLYVAGAYSYDRTGQVYRGPLIPDERVTTDWAHFGSNDDPVVQAAVSWLHGQQGCAR